MSVRTKLGSLIVNVGNAEKWIQYSSKSSARAKWGLQEVIKRYNSHGELSQIIHKYSTNPLFGYQTVSGSPEYMRTIWNSVAQMSDKHSVARFLETLKR